MYEQAGSTEYACSVCKVCMKVRQRKMKRLERMKVMKDMTMKIRAQERMDANSSWLLSELLAACRNGMPG